MHFPFIRCPLILLLLGLLPLTSRASSVYNPYQAYETSRNLQSHSLQSSSPAPVYFTTTNVSSRTTELPPSAPTQVEMTSVRPAPLPPQQTPPPQQRPSNRASVALRQAAAVPAQTPAYYAPQSQANAVPAGMPAPIHPPFQRRTGMGHPMPPPHPFQQQQQQQQQHQGQKPRYRWYQRRTDPVPARAPTRKSSVSFFEQLFSLIPTILSFFGIGSSSSSSSSSSGPQARHPFDDIFRMLGVDSSAVGALAMNALVFIAEKVANRFLPAETENEGRKLGTFSKLLQKLPDIDKMSNLVQAAVSEDLPERIINNMASGEAPSSSQCMQKLVCKMAPVIRGMQRSLFEALPMGISARSKRKPVKSMTDWMMTYFPSVDEFGMQSATCEQRFLRCGPHLNDISNSHPST